MKKRIVMALLVAVWSLTGAVGAFATGFSIYEAGSRATALGGAFTASADDGSALFYNPAGLSFQSGTSVELNLMPIAPRFKFAEATSMAAGDPATGEGAANTFLVPGVYATHNNGKQLAYGVGVYAPFGLGVEWNEPDSWVGRQANYDVAIQTVYVTPALSYLVNEQFAVSLGLDFAVQHLKLNRMTLDPTEGQNSLDQDIEGSSDLNVTPTLGLMYRPDDKLSFGVMYHHKKTMKYKDGDLELKNIAAAGSNADVFATTLLGTLTGTPGANSLKTTIESELNLPWILSLGGSYRFSEKFRAELNYVRFGWSEFKSLELNTPIGALNQTLHFDYEDSWQIRAGAEFAATPKLDLMAGYVRDTTPQPIQSVSPILPDSDRNDYSVGLRYKLTNWDFNLSYMAVIGEDRTNIENGRSARGSATYPTGTYKSLANIYGLGVGYHF
jgi:long-chain fatty acid transport protein